MSGGDDLEGQGKLNLRIEAGELHLCHQEEATNGQSRGLGSRFL